MSAEQRAKIGRSLRGKPKSKAHKKATSKALVLYWAGYGKTPRSAGEN
jgi:hypothetical protein